MIILLVDKSIIWLKFQRSNGSVYIKTSFTYGEELYILKTLPTNPEYIKEIVQKALVCTFVSSVIFIMA